MFHAADIMLLNKVDLLPYLKFDVQQCEDYARRVNPNIKILHVSATSGEGMDEWLVWLMQQRSGLVAQHLNALEQQVQALRNSLQL
jgi:hydrogenase nickel incorporation protein HypB